MFLASAGPVVASSFAITQGIRFLSLKRRSESTEVEGQKDNKVSDPAEKLTCYIA